MRSWKFSKSSEKNLKKLLEINTDNNDRLQENHFLSLFGERIGAKINAATVSSDVEDIECIEISSSSDSEHNLCSPLHQDVQVTDSVINEIQPDIDISNAKMDDLVKCFIDTLELDDAFLKEEDILHLAKLSPEELKATFSLLNSNLSAQGIYRLTHSLCSSENNNKYLIENLCSHILLPLLIKSEYVKLIEAAVVEVLNNFADIVCVKLIEPLVLANVSNNSNVLATVLQLLKEEDQRTVFRNFLLSLNDLQEWHIPIIQILYSSQTEAAVRSKLLELMKNNALIFNNNKSFGKLLLTIIQTSEKNADYLYILEYIVDLNKSVFKRTARINLDKLYK